MTRSYGDIVMTRHEDGTITVESADDVIDVSTQLLAGCPPLDSRHFDEEGNLVVDTAGEYRYRPVRFADNGLVVVCARVRPTRDDAIDKAMNAETGPSPLDVMTLEVENTLIRGTASQ